MGRGVGLRTHILVCVGSALIMIVSAYGFAEVLHRRTRRARPFAGGGPVLSGIGFLGAGSILLRGEIVRGLTTAASLWSVAVIGLAVGGGWAEALAHRSARSSRGMSVQGAGGGDQGQKRVVERRECGLRADRFEYELSPGAGD